MSTQAMTAGKYSPARRWLNIALRALHLAGVVLTGIAIVGGGAYSAAAVALMLATGFGLYAIDLREHPGLWREVAGVLISVKLLLLLVMLSFPPLAEALFWLLLIASGVVSHAPREFRHRRILG